MITLYPHQRAAIDALYDWFRANKDGNPLLVLPTGSGKSVVLAAVIQEIFATWPDQRVLMLTHVKELIEQNASRLKTVWPQAPLGIYSAGLGRKDAFNPVIFAGIQSVFAKAMHLGRFDLIFVDEAHLIGSDSGSRYQVFFDAARKINPDVRIVGLTATAFRTTTGALTYGDMALFSDVAYEIGLLQLIAEGFLCPLVTKSTTTQLDVSGVKSRNGEFIQGQLERAVDQDSVTHAALDEVETYGADRGKWLVFCAGVNHAEHVTAALLARGIPAGCVTGKTPKGRRDNLIASYRNGRIRALVNANVLCLDEETEILTSDGFIGIDAMTQERLIAAWKQDGSVEFTKPESIVKRMRAYDEVMVSGGPFRVTGNHRMVVYCGFNLEKTKVVSAIDMAKPAMQSIPAYGMASPFNVLPQQEDIKNRSARIRSNSYNYRRKGMSERDARNNAEVNVANREAMRYLAPSELTKEHCEFIGFWLGDGTKSNGRVSISQSTAYQDNVDYMDSLISRLNLHCHRKIYAPATKSNFNSIRWTFARGTGGMGQKVAGNGYYSIEPYLNKDGSHLFWGLDADQLSALLYGLWLADGCHHARVRGTYVVGTQLKLYELLQAISSVRGINSVITKASAPRADNHIQQYRFGWGGRNKWSINGRRIAIEAVAEKSERVWCVTSSTGFLICRRRGRVFVTGNTTGFDVPATDLLVVLRPTQSPGLYVQIMGRGMRIAPGKTDCLVLDFAGNTTRHGPVDQVKAWIPKPKEDGSAAPIKVCPGCGAKVATSVRICACGHVFEFADAPSHFATASDAPVLSTDTKSLVTRKVSHCFYRHHQSIGKLPSLRVDYYDGMLRVASEWVCLSHDGYARAKAAQWWIRRVGTAIPVPPTVKDALDLPLSDIVKQPKTLTLKQGKYVEIVGYEFE